MELTAEMAASEDSSDQDSGVEEATPSQHGDEHEDGPQKKKARSTLRQPPTADELISLRQTQNLFHSNLFQLQTTEMLKEVTPPEKHMSRLRQWLAQFETWLAALPSRPSRSLSRQPWLASSGLQLPLPASLPDEPDAEPTFGFAPPVAVTVAGPLAADVLERDGTVDLLLEMPDSCVESSDVINARYWRKRALYLTYLAWRLRSCPLVASCQFSLVDGDVLRPALLLHPVGVGAKHYCVRLLPVAPPSLVSLDRLSPVRCNVRSKWVTGKGVPPQQDTPTPHYNSGVLADLQASSLAALCSEELAQLPAARQAVRMLAVWLRQRGLDRGPGAIDVQLLTLFMLWLFRRRRLSKLMSAYQLMRNVWVQLTKTDWAGEGITFVESPTDDQPALCQFTECFAVTLVEPSGFLNVAAAVNGATYRRLRDEAERAVTYLDDPDTDSFQVLFMTPLPFVEAFDQLAHISVSSLAAAAAVAGRRHDWPAGGVAALLSRLVSVLTEGLTDRVTLLDVERPPAAVWSPADPAPTDTLSSTVTVGLRLNPARLTSLVDKGPDSELRESTVHFRRFWGELAETRRFQDGSIREAVIWKAETLHQYRTICRQIVLHLLQRHFKVPSSEVQYPCDGPELLLTQTRRLPAFPYGSGEEAELVLERAFGRLAALLRRMHELPLSVAAVHAASASLRHAEVFPPLPDMHHALTGRSVRHGSNQLLERQTELSLPWAPVCDVILQLEISGKWPEEPEAIRRVKTAFHLQMRQELTDQGLTSAVRRDAVLVLCDGYLFRLCVAYPREPALLRMRKQPELAALLERRTVQLPRLTSALAGVQRQHPAYSASCRLALRWLSAQMLSDLVPDMAAELLMAQVFLAPAPLSSPEQPAVALLRWLRLLAHTDWRRLPLLVNLNDDLAPERQAELQARFRTDRERLPAWTVFTPYDVTGSAWTRAHPTPAVLQHLQKLAGAAHTLLTSQLTSRQGCELDWRAAFRPPLETFDMRVRLVRRRLPRRHQAVDPAGEPSRADPFTQQPYEALPPPAWDPAHQLVDELRAATADWALVCHDRCGGHVIGVLVRPDALRPRPFSAFRSEADTPAADGAAAVVHDVVALVDLVRTVGAGLVDEVQVEVDRLAGRA